MNIKITLLFIATGLLLAGCSASAGKPSEVPPTPAVTDNTITAEGRLEPIRDATIAFRASGVISKILVDEGQEVKQGQFLIQLGDESDSSYAAAQLELASAQKALNDLHNSADTDLAQAVIDLKDAQEKYDRAEDYLKYLQTSNKVPQTRTRYFLVQTWGGYYYNPHTQHFKGPAPEDWIIDAQNDLALKTAELKAAQRTYDRLKDGVDRDQLAVLEARLDAAKAQLTSLSVLAPFDGVVTDLAVKSGGSINAGEPAVTVGDFSQWLVKTTDLTEIDVVELEEAQPVTVTLDALPEVELKGKILSIGQSYSENQGDVVYEVTILLTDTHPAMRWGMTATVNFGGQD